MDSGPYAFVVVEKRTVRTSVTVLATQVTGLLDNAGNTSRNPISVKLAKGHIAAKTEQSRVLNVRCCPRPRPCRGSTGGTSCRQTPSRSLHVAFVHEDEH